MNRLTVRKNNCILLGLLLFFCVEVSANEQIKLDHIQLDMSNKISLQRGARTFTNYCLGCHSAQYVRYSLLKEIGLPESLIKKNFIPSEGKIGDLMTVNMPPISAKQWFGVQPPDLSVIARSRGADWLYTYLRKFYRDDTRPTGWNNIVFDKVAMPHSLWELQGAQVKQGERLISQGNGKLTIAEYDLLVYDLVNYLGFIAEPNKLKDRHTGSYILIYLSILFVFAYLLKQEFWKDVHKEK